MTVLPVRVLAFETSLGWTAIALRGDAVTAMAFGRRTPRQAVDALGLEPPLEPVDAPTAAEQALIKRIKAYAAGADDDFLDVKIETSHLTPFAARVVRHCRRIPAGKTLTYGQLARKAGSPGAARAVGNVMRTNRFPLLVPCHRVVGACGSLGGYSAPDGLQMKRRLLAMEGVYFDEAADATDGAVYAGLPR